MKNLIAIVLLVFTTLSVKADVSIVVGGRYRFSQYYTMRKLFELDKFFECESSILIEDNEPVYVWNNGEINTLFIPDNAIPGFMINYRDTLDKSDEFCKRVQGILYKIAINCANKVDIENLKILGTNCNDERNDERND